MAPMPNGESTLAAALNSLATLGTERDREQLVALLDRLDAARLRVLVVGEAKRGTGGTHVTGVGYLHAATAFPGHPRLSHYWFQASPRFRPGHACAPGRQIAPVFPHVP